MIKPLGNNIYYEPTKEERPIGDASLCEYGKVLAIGKDVQEIKVGDTIIFTKWGVNEIEINGQKHFVINEDPGFVLGTLEL